MAPTKEALRRFILDNSNVYPYNEVKCTRNGYYCKWVILQSQGRNTDIIRVGAGYLYAVPTACFDNDTLQQMLISKAAFPLSNESQDIEDCMSIWGRNISERWHQLVLNFLCTNKKRTRKDLYRLCIQIRVDDLIRDRLHLQPVLAHLVILQWYVAFDDIYDFITKEYFELCMRSFHYVVVKINKALSPNGLTPTSIDSDSDESVHCIPVVSSSSE